MAPLIFRAEGGGGWDGGEFPALRLEARLGAPVRERASALVGRGMAGGAARLAVDLLSFESGEWPGGGSRGGAAALAAPYVAWPGPVRGGRPGHGDSPRALRRRKVLAAMDLGDPLGDDHAEAAEALGLALEALGLVGGPQPMWLDLPAPAWDLAWEAALELAESTAAQGDDPAAIERAQGWWEFGPAPVDGILARRSPEGGWGFGEAWGSGEWPVGDIRHFQSFLLDRLAQAGEWAEVWPGWPPAWPAPGVLRDLRPSPAAEWERCLALNRVLGLLSIADPRGGLPEAPPEGPGLVWAPWVLDGAEGHVDAVRLAVLSPRGGPPPQGGGDPGAAGQTPPPADIIGGERAAPPPGPGGGAASRDGEAAMGETEEMGEAEPLGPPPGEEPPPRPEPAALLTWQRMAALGPAASLANLTAVLAAVGGGGSFLGLSGRERSDRLRFDEASAWAARECAEAVAAMAGPLEGEAPADLRDFASAVLGVVLAARSVPSPSVTVLGSAQDGRGVVERGYPLLTPRPTPAPMMQVPVATAEALDRAAALGPPLLAFASRERLEELADLDPGGFMGRLEELGAMARSLEAPAVASAGRMEALRAFFAPGS